MTLFVCSQRSVIYITFSRSAGDEGKKLAEPWNDDAQLDTTAGEIRTIKHHRRRGLRKIALDGNSCLWRSFQSTSEPRYSSVAKCQIWTGRQGLCPEGQAAVWEWSETKTTLKPGVQVQGHWVCAELTVCFSCATFFFSSLAQWHLAVHVSWTIHPSIYLFIYLSFYLFTLFGLGLGWVGGGGECLWREIRVIKHTREIK